MFQRIVTLAKGLDGADVEIGVYRVSFRLYGCDFVLREVLCVDDDCVVGGEDSGVFGVEAEEDGVGMLLRGNIHRAAKSQ
ncbi:hypothetical protein SDC9_157173 [bioreactor metagenome]|uniref:Uncharacterized protein n=1 Tax=bioreactor metagenome TaxID=1076179 RepID=A0A645F7L6_9ZZZZ